MQPSSTTSYQTFRLQCAHGSVPSCMSDCWRLASRTCTECLNPPATEQEIRPGINGGNEMRRWQQQQVERSWKSCNFCVTGRRLISGGAVQLFNYCIFSPQLPDGETFDVTETGAGTKLVQI